ncbi:Six-hairpin glycosidase [Glarea lozoyensis ATCC 20868]|uniref:Six-hairpin glycosidase n=1 Tax=Glarea lozoyensis (strain ATCC 20868 / MF5171) TaxID=1116229 RepID=S3CLS3_GLAL2|nr:Six-hairpin glycosidase [Glarea lozoyensis ATCC 20868]EPE26149.1 Six-hairpin glycosidase [Glarea lozoyensis ATCC 20868]
MSYTHLLSYATCFLTLGAQSLAAPASRSTEAELAFDALQTYYNTSSGLWSTTGWWNSANCLTTAGQLAAIDRNILPTAEAVFSNTFAEAQKFNLGTLKVVKADFNIETMSGPPALADINTLAQTNPKGFLNDYYDDEGWWALGWIQAFDVTQNEEYLDTAVDIFNDMAKGATTPCGNQNQPIWWDKKKTYVNAIANELYLSVASHLANRIPSNGTYLTSAQNQWKWFQESGLINAQNTINDGLTTACKNNNGTVWSYNQGVILGALVELSKATGNPSLLDTAATIATAAIKALSDEDGILHDVCEPNCGADGAQFKGVFMRNLRLLQNEAPDDEIEKFIGANAASIWKYNRASEAARSNLLSVVWSGPFIAPANASTQSSALDALVAAQALGVLPSNGFSIASRRRK